MSALTEPTSQQLIALATPWLAQKGVETPRLDAELLLAFALNCSRVQLYLNFDFPLINDHVQKFRELLKKRGDRIPLAYLTGHKEFYGRDFLVTPEVLVPRPDSELLIHHTLKEIQGPHLHGLEVGVGSGILAITLLLEYPTLVMSAIDISLQAVKCAQANAIKHGVAHRLYLLQADCFGEDFFTTQKFDFIISNPPYISEAEFLTLAPEITQHEPKTALVAPNNGLAFYEFFCLDGFKKLNPDGFMIFEIGETQGPEVALLFKNHDVKTFRDEANKDRVLWIK